MDKEKLLKDLREIVRKKRRADDLRNKLVEIIRDIESGYYD